MVSRRYRIAQNFAGENFGEFGEFSVIHQSFAPPKMPLENFTKVRLRCINTK